VPPRLDQRARPRAARLARRLQGGRPPQPGRREGPPLGPREIDELARRQRHLERAPRLLVDQLEGAPRQRRQAPMEIVHGAPFRLPIPREPLAGSPPPCRFPALASSCSSSTSSTGRSVNRKVRRWASS